MSCDAVANDRHRWSAHLLYEFFQITSYFLCIIPEHAWSTDCGCRIRRIYAITCMAGCYIKSGIITRTRKGPRDYKQHGITYLSRILCWSVKQHGLSALLRTTLGNNSRTALSSSPRVGHLHLANIKDQRLFRVTFARSSNRLALRIARSCENSADTDQRV